MTRWNRRLLFGAIVVLVQALAGLQAGFNAPTLPSTRPTSPATRPRTGSRSTTCSCWGRASARWCRPASRAGSSCRLLHGNGDRLRSRSAPRAPRPRCVDLRRSCQPACRGRGRPERPGTEGGAVGLTNPLQRRRDGHHRASTSPRRGRSPSACRWSRTSTSTRPSPRRPRRPTPTTTAHPRRSRRRFGERAGVSIRRPSTTPIHSRAPVASSGATHRPFGKLCQTGLGAPGLQAADSNL